jgi:hypothetical protein
MTLRSQAPGGGCPRHTQVGQVGRVGAEMVATQAPEPERAGVPGGFDVAGFDADAERHQDLPHAHPDVFVVKQDLGPGHWPPRRRRCATGPDQAATSNNAATLNKRRCHPKTNPPAGPSRTPALDRAAQPVSTGHQAHPLIETPLAKRLNRNVVLDSKFVTGDGAATPPHLRTVLSSKAMAHETRP